jgi:hypothetical protein
MTCYSNEMTCFALRSQLLPVNIQWTFCGVRYVLVAAPLRLLTLLLLFNDNNNNSVALVSQRTIPTERPFLVGDVSANFLRIEG